MSWAAFIRLATLAIPLHTLASHASAQQLKSTEVASGLRQPIGVRAAPGDVHRLFVLERRGTIRIVKDGVLLAAPFLDIASDVSTDGEGGLIGLAFHPDYARNGRFFVSMIDLSHAASVREYRVGQSPDRADASSGPP
jgi:glucose/arabinose dehydrogenase